MRRLLVFGTGSAIAGIVILIAGFIAAYDVVTNLQIDLKNIGGAAAATGPLEYATLEAVFLGIMVGIGYGLVTKGLDGVRREEQMERGEVWAEPMFSPGSQTVQSALQQGQKVKLLKPASPAKAGQGTGAKGRPPQPPAQSKPQFQAQPSVVPAPVMVEQTAEPQPPPAPPTPAESSVVPEESMEVEPPSATAAPEILAVEGPTTEEPATPPELKWEGSAAELPKGVEILPEPELHGASATLEEERSREAMRSQTTSEAMPEPGSEVAVPGAADSTLPPTAEQEEAAARERARARRAARRGKRNPPETP